MNGLFDKTQCKGPVTQNPCSRVFVKEFDQYKGPVTQNSCSCVFVKELDQYKVLSVRIQRLLGPIKGVFPTPDTGQNHTDTQNCQTDI